MIASVVSSKLAMEAAFEVGTAAETLLLQLRREHDAGLKHLQKFILQRTAGAVQLSGHGGQLPNPLPSPNGGRLPTTTAAPKSRRASWGQKRRHESPRPERPP